MADEYTISPDGKLRWKPGMVAWESVPSAEQTAPPLPEAPKSREEVFGYHYYPVVTGDTVESIAKAHGKTDAADVKALLDLNALTVATHTNLLAGEAVKSPSAIKANENLVEGQVFILPPGWTPLVQV
jgi:LysM domain